MVQDHLEASLATLQVEDNDKYKDYKRKKMDEKHLELVNSKKIISQNLHGTGDQTNEEANLYLK